MGFLNRRRSSQPEIGWVEQSPHGGWDVVFDSGDRITNIASLSMASELALGPVEAGPKFNPPTPGTRSEWLPEGADTEGVSPTGRNMTVGTEVSVYGEPGRFIVRWIKGEEITVFGGTEGHEKWRTFRLDDIKRVHYKTKTRGNVASLQRMAAGSLTPYELYILHPDLPNGTLPGGWSRRSSGTLDFDDVNWAIRTLRLEESQFRANGATDVAIVLHGDPNNFFYRLDDFIDNVLTKTSRRTVAHQLADPTAVTHCPFCGSGEVVARSDGSVECVFCTRYFTIAEQPQYSSMPGAPSSPMQEMADEVMDEAMLDENGLPIVDEQTFQQAPTFVAPQDENAGQPAAEKKPPFPTSARLRTSTGSLLDEESYALHLALRHGDREAILSNRED